jgi:thiol:disulfide interchange protein DsbC
MRKVIVATLSLIAVSCNESPQAVNTIEQNVRSSMPATLVKSVNETQFAGLYEVEAGDNLFYADASGRYLFIGHIYDLKTATNITQLRIDALKQEKQINE